MNDALKAASAIKLPDISEALAALKNKDINIDERWDAYSAMVNNGVLRQDNSYGDGFIGLLKRPGEIAGRLTLYDDFYVERHQTVRFSDMYEQITEDEYNPYDGDSLEEWREAVLASGYASFTYDW